MKLRSILLATTILSAALINAANAAEITWTGAGDGVSVFAENNWVITSGTIGANGVGSAPPNNTINPATPIGHDLVAHSGTLGGASGASNHLDLGAAGSLLVTGGTLRMNTNAGSNFGIRSNSAGNAAGVQTLTVEGGEVIAEFLLDISATLDGDGQLTLDSSGNPLNASTVNFESFNASLNLLNVTPAVFEAQHLSKITVFGAPAVIGSNLLVTAASSGSIITATPEPSSLVVLLLCCALLGAWAQVRRRSRLAV